MLQPPFRKGVPLPLPIAAWFGGAPLPHYANMLGNELQAEGAEDGFVDAATPLEFRI